MKIGILGGTFDPPHIGHLNISLEAIKRFHLNKVIWLITKKNPLKKNNSSNDILNRIKLCNDFIKKNKNSQDLIKEWLSNMLFFLFMILF